MVYAASRYNIAVDMDDGSLVLYSTRTGGITKFDADHRTTILKALENGTSGREDWDDALLRQGHFIIDGTDELELVRAKRRVGIRDPNRLDVVVLPTLDCNFRCVYCYETRRPGLMSDETRNHVGAFLAREVPTAKVTMLHWFGGEPLMHVPPIIYLTKLGLRIAAETGTRLVAQATTNGYLLTGARLDDLLEAGVRDYQVTVDGYRDTHDQMRPLAGGKPSFDRIIQNCRDLLAFDNTHLTLRVNFNSTNVEHVEPLFAEFPPEVRNRIRFVLEPIFGEGCVSASGSLTTARMMEFMDQAYRRAAQEGFGTTAATTNLAPEKLVYCYAERRHQVIIGPDGNVFKCAVQHFTEEESLGRLMDDGSIEWNHAYDDWMALGDDFAPICQSCSYLPLCMGGCRKTQILNRRDSCSLMATNSARILQVLSGKGLTEVVRNKVLQPQ